MLKLLTLVNAALFALLVWLGVSSNIIIILCFMFMITALTTAYSSGVIFASEKIDLTVSLGFNIIVFAVIADKLTITFEVLVYLGFFAIACLVISALLENLMLSTKGIFPT